MPLLADYAITPDVFVSTSYSDDEVCRLHLRVIGEVMKGEGLVRDLRAGDWRKLFAEDKRPWHRTGKELVKKWATQGRLIIVPPELAGVPIRDQEWCEEALATHSRLAMTGGVIVTQSAKDAYRSDSLVAAIGRLDSATWWRKRSPSIRLRRTIADYQRHLDLILRCANSVSFLDPHLDLTTKQYGRFADVLAAAAGRMPAPSIEIHRVCYEGSGARRRVLSIADLERDFSRKMRATLQQAGLHVDVFVWDDFHDRYLISNLVGISLPNGFDTSSDPTEQTTWTRLGPRERDDIQREFDPASNGHHLHGKFTIP